MGDMLSQAEINALLGGDSGDSTEPVVASVDAEAVPKPDEGRTEQKTSPEHHSESPADTLTNDQKDILGEIGNISMGTSATTLYALLGQKVMITTPRVKIMRWSELAADYSRPCVGIRVDYKDGIEGSNLLLLKERDVKIITNLMMGGDGTQDIDEALNEIDLSAIAEAMNQMVGSSSTSLASLVKMRIDIDTPHAFVLDFNDVDLVESVSFAGDDVVCTAFRMQIGTLIDSEIMQILPMKFATELVNIMQNEVRITQEPQQQAQPAQPAPSAAPLKAKNTASQQSVMDVKPLPQQTQAQQGGPRMEQQSSYAPQPQPVFQPNVNVQPAQFQSFDAASIMQQKENIDIIMDVPLEVTVELGRTSKKIKEILEFSPGTIIELDKLAGEPIDILVNGKFVAKGEVVVIDENFGIRISDIINEEHRI